MIYIVQPSHGGAFKIGCSMAVEKRAMSIAALFPYGVEVIASFEGNLIGEAFLHLCLRPVAIGKEWFHPCPATWRFVLDVVDGGRPAYLPSDQRASAAEVTALALARFGTLQTAALAMGHTTTNMKQIFGGWSSTGYATQARLAFAIALRDGTLPGYIMDLHRDAPALAVAA